ncbi:ABC transporter substrate-binding protein [Actinocatenispora thailandica]|uniref:ABC transporter substrate-binding protein n=1 Tax=Actinocatenispora thailandica TaxID=227318 RepID=A0A7R7DWH0_9ACTN|nr:extracellular solute-binding protein [Actinocatenispora thailandica]BCJ38642.1 ABC transporter substrate-binding protein [Actinocatenispora thailandica]
MALSRRSLLAGAGLGALGLASSGALAGCSTGGTTASATGPVEGDITVLTPMYQGATGKQLLEGKLLKQFTKKHPKVNVKVDYTDYGSLNEKITTGLAGGLLPDVLMIGVGWVPPFAYKKVLAPLPASAGTKYDYQERVLAPSKYDGKLYALPVVLDARLVVYRKDHFAKAGLTSPPKDWTELRGYAKELAQHKNGKLVRAGFDPFSIDLRQCWENFLFANGGSMFDDSGRKVLFDDEAGIGALQLFLDVIKDRSADPSFVPAAGQPATIQQGRSSIMMSDTALWMNMQQQSPELIADDKIGVFVMRNKQEAMLQGGTLACVSSRSQHRAAAQALVEFLATPANVLPAAQQRGTVPSVASLRDSSYVKQNKLVDFALSNLDKSVSEGGTPAWMEIREKVKPTLQTAIVGQRTAKQAIGDLTDVAKSAIGRL